jgi:predicted ribosomally synthesized peptide with SipW-like signal peptide
MTFPDRSRSKRKAMPAKRHSLQRGTTKKVVFTVAVVLAALASIGGVFAAFTDTQAGGPTPITTGIVHIVLGTPAGDHGTLTTGPIVKMAEGDSVARVVQLTNNTTVGALGTTGLAAVKGLTVQSSTSGANAGSDIVTDTTNGLHVTVQSCATAPTESGGVPGPWTYTCSGGFTTVVNNVALATFDATAQDLTASAPVEGATIYFVITVALPTTYADAYSYNAGNCSTGGTAGVSEQLQNCALTVSYNFTATQRAGTNQ